MGGGGGGGGTAAVGHGVGIGDGLLGVEHVEYSVKILKDAISKLMAVIKRKQLSKTSIKYWSPMVKWSF